MKKQIDLSELYTQSPGQVEEVAKNNKDAERRALNCHHLFDPKGNHYRHSNCIATTQTTGGYSAFGKMDINNPQIQAKLHQECRKIMKNK